MWSPQTDDHAQERCQPLTIISSFLSLPWATQICPLNHSMYKVNNSYFMASTLLEVEALMPSS